VPSPRSRSITAATLEEALRVLADLGARIVEERMPDLSQMLDAWLAICTSEAATPPGPRRRPTDFTMPMNVAGTPSICLPSGGKGHPRR
jgi:Asp-tRNA(Asn)/Glu-tRNA(Gln) amidotransferase A subunit family amidase